MDMLKKASSVRKKMTSPPQPEPKNTTKKTNKPKKKKSKKRLDKENGVVIGSPSPHSPGEGDFTDPQSAISDNPDIESDSSPTKETKKRTENNSRSSNSTNNRSTLLRFQIKETSHDRTVGELDKTLVNKNSAGKFNDNNEYNTASDKTTASSATAIKIKKVAVNYQSSQSNRVKESISQGSLSSKSSKTSSNNSSGTSVNRSFSKTEVERQLANKKSSLNLNESLRWDQKCHNQEEENERLNQYKLNRRKRYLAASNQKYSEWVKTLSGSNHNVSASQSDSGVQSQTSSGNGDYGSGREDLTSPNDQTNVGRGTYNTYPVNGLPSNDSLKTVSSSSTNSSSAAYIKTVTSVPEVMVPGLAGSNIIMHRGSSQVMLNC